MEISLVDLLSFVISFASTYNYEALAQCSLLVSSYCDVTVEYHRNC